ncbi:T9SS type A sorting domain-containing protein [Taibaiella soli]|uniref:Secretion system C-terminal sorting domain-containing protein n=1 Tax=Taibaiella soli TaxID=1649169 RepID=A0A2W2AGG7_9BACT|nr:T9SS type A sorting domain-containing protein [Taibaiella soli]PZF71350.1 hypothetical protein DN068_18835 [Taibaiella soli]
MKKTLVLIATSLLLIGKVFAQCPTPPKVTAPIIAAATCPSNGSVTLGGNGVGDSNVLYRVIKAPNNSYVGITQQGNSPTFINLEPGAYSIEMSCTAGSIAKDTVNFTIANQYTPPSVDVSSQSNCTGGSAQIILSLSNIQGSSAPLQYAFYPTTDPSTPDNLLTYGSSTSQTFSSYGSFMVRVRDACGSVSTKMINVAGPSLYQAGLNGPVITSCDTFLSKLDLTDSVNNNRPVNIPPDGITVNVYKLSAPCTKGPLFSTVTFAGNTPISGLTFTAPTDPSFIIETINACGVVSNCVKSSSVDPHTQWYITNASCNIPATAIGLKHGSDERFFGAMTYCAYRNNIQLFCTTDPQDVRFNNIPSSSGDKFYIVATDQCGRVDTSDVVQTPAGAPTTVVSASYATCTPGIVTAYFEFANIPLPEKAGLIVTSGPCCIGTTLVNNLSGGYGYGNNLVPGTYTMKVTYPGHECTDLSDVTLNIPPVDTTVTLLATAAQSCGGKASITAIVKPSDQLNGLGGRTDVIDLVDASTGAVVQTTTNGVFNNVVPGDYTLIAKTTFNKCTSGTVYYSSASVMVTAQGSPPVVTKKFGIICEDASGNQLGAGMAVFNVVGFAPFDVFYNTLGQQPATPQLTGQGSIIDLNNLMPNQTYFFWFRDACGNVRPTQLGIFPLGKVWVEQRAQPCNNQPFSLSLPEYPDATYIWKNQNGVAITTSRTYDFGIYNNAYNGQYTGYMTLANGCVARTLVVNLNSDWCGQPLPLRIVSFDAVNAGNYNKLNWVTADEVGVSHFEVERSIDGNNWNLLTAMSIASPNGNTTHNYDYTDKAPSNGSNFYRLKIVDNNGQYVYSEVRTVKNNGLSGMQLYPNPAGAVVTVTLSEDVKDGVNLSVYNSVGKLISKQQLTSRQTVISTAQYPPGVYFVVVSNGNTIYRQKLIKQ